MRLSFPGLFVCALALIALSACSNTKAPEQKAAAVDQSASENASASMKTEPIQKRTLEKSLRVTGQIHPEFGKEVSLSSRVTGRIVNVLVSPGQRVSRGETLALIDSQQISDLQAELIEAHSRLAIAKSHEERERQIYEEQLKRPKTLIEARARFDEAKAQADFSDSELKRNEQLHREDIVAAKDLRAAQANHAKAQSALRQATADLQREEGLYQNKAMMKRDYQVVQAEAHAAQQHVDTLKQRLVFLGMTPSQVGSVITTGKIIGTTPVIAPLSGIITQQNVALGEIVDPAKQAFRITDLSTVSITADVPDASLPKLAIGMPVKAKVNGFPGEIFAGTINYIGTHVNQETRTAPIRARIVNKGLKLKASLFAEIDIAMPPQQVLACPKNAIQERDGHKVVYVADHQDYTERQVELGQSNENYYQVLSGLNEGDSVVTAGSLLLKAKVASSHSPTGSESGEGQR